MKEKIKSNRRIGALRLRKLGQGLTRVVAQWPRKKFDMDNIVVAIGDGETDSLDRALERGYVTRTCGAAACALGYGPTFFPPRKGRAGLRFNKWGAVEVVAANGQVEGSPASVFFHLTDDEEQVAFYSGWTMTAAKKGKQLIAMADEILRSMR